MKMSLSLERVAEELMGRRKWKLYQELARSNLNTNTATNINQQLNNIETETLHSNGQENLPQPITNDIVNQQLDEQQEKQLEKGEKSPQQPEEIEEQTTENHSQENEIVTTIKGEQQLQQNEHTNIKPEIQSATAKPENLATDSAEDNNKLKRNSTELQESGSNNRIKEPEDPVERTTPIDWKPQKDCYFCVDGKLLTVNERGELVAESGTVPAEPELANKKIPLKNFQNYLPASDSDSSESDTAEATIPKAANKGTVADLLKLPQQNMTSFETMAQLATLASLNGGFPPIYPSFLYNQILQQMHSTSTSTTEPSTAVSPSATKASSSPVEGTGEQPLDLSAKPSSGSPFSNDPKQVFRAKPRVSAIPGRRTYTEEELNNALQDILSGKLGTRRAAVLYGIPRSTLRNKVYKLALDNNKRECNQQQVSPTLIDDDDIDVSDCEEDKGFEAVRTAALQKYRSSENNDHKSENMFKEQQHHQHQQQHQPQPQTPQPKLQPVTTSTTPQTPPIAVANPWLDPGFLQNLLISGLLQQKNDDPALQDVLRTLLLQNQGLIKTPNDQQHLNNGKSTTATDPQNMMQNLALSMQQHYQSQLQNRLIKSETPERGIVGGDPNDSEDSAVILKIPSFKPPASGKNGDSVGEITPQSTPPLHSRSPHAHMPAGISSPVMRSSNDSQSPPMGLSGLTLREAMGNSFARTFHQQNSELHGKPSVDQSMEYKRPSISVIKNLGGTDMTRFGASPNLMASINANNAANNANNALGKGTRPKRGKYRNYDRDSLVEAVKAVQRGEMSVHRAGSYYGVPHSTLEYKVKERHLMRPRKREPKPQPLDGGSSTTTSSMKAHDASSSSLASMRTIDKTKTLPTTKPPMKTPPFPATSPNGMKMGIFDPTQLQYASHMFWPHPPGYTGLPMTGTTAAAAANAEAFFASQMIQRMQEDALRQSGVGNSSSKSAAVSLAAATAAAAAATSNSSSNNNQTKSARELAESLYDGTNTNGSFLDDIIRHSLDRKTGESTPHGALLDQLVKNPRHPLNDGERNNSNKRSGSPYHYNQHGIKRERNSSSSGETDRESIEREHMSKESVEAMLKYRDGLSLRLDEKHLRSSSEDINGATTPELKLSHQTETEDSS